MFDTPDNYDIWSANEQRKDAALSRLPICAICDNPIQDERTFCYNGVWICQGCINENMEEVPYDE